MQVGRRQEGNNTSAAPMALPITIEIASYYFPFYFRSEGYREKQWTPGGNILCLAEVRLQVPGMTYPITVKDMQIRINKDGDGLNAFVPSRNERNPITGEDAWVRGVDLPKVVTDTINSMMNFGPQALTDTLLAAVYAAWYEDCGAYYPESLSAYQDSGYPGWVDQTKCTDRPFIASLQQSAPTAPIVAVPRSQPVRPTSAQPQPQPPAPQASPPQAAPKPPAQAPKPASRRVAPPVEDDDLSDPFAE